MAFNPFHAFRKHQKVWFAGLTILCMITFILTGSTLTGRGDFFDWLQTSLGGEGKYPQIASLYGKKIDQRDVVTLREQRLIANEYMAAANQLARNNLVADLQKAGDKLGALKSQVDMVVQFYRQGFLRHPEFYQMYRKQIDGMRSVLAGTGKKEEAELLGDFLTALDQDFRLGQQQLYFGGSTELEGLLDFMIWRHQADRLGIELTNTDVENEIRRDTGGRLTPENYRQILGYLAQTRRGLTNQNLATSLANEFRVRLAQASLVGYESGSVAHVPAPVTPFEFWEFYRDTRTEVSVTVLPLAVQDFVDQVKDEPTDAELRELYDKYKDKEATPASATPGFKQPRRVQVEWVAARADAPRYQKAAELALAALRAASPFAFEARLLTEYENMKRPQFQAPSWTEPWNGPRYPLHESSRNQPAAAAAAVAGVVGALGSQGSAFTTLAAHHSAVVGREVRDRLRLGASMILSASEPLPFLGAALAYQHTPKEEFFPLKTVEGRVLERIRDELAHDLVVGNLNAVKKELDTIKNRSEKVRRTDAEKYLAGAVERFGLQHASTTEPRDQYDVGTDPSLQPLKEAYVRAMPQDARAKQFPSLFFSNVRVYEAERWPRDLQMRGFGEDWQWQSAPEPFLYWKTSDKPAYVPEFAEVKDQVLKAWRFEKARLLADAKAKAIETKARSAKGDAVPVLKDSTKHPERIFHLTSVSRLRPRTNALMTGTRQYEEYQVPDDRIEYPTPDFVKTVLGLKEKGDVTVATDRPKAHYYVVVLDSRLEPRINEFYVRYQESSPAAFQQDTLYDLFERERKDLYVQTFVAQLRLDARLDINAENRRRAEERENQAE